MTVTLLRKVLPCIFLSLLARVGGAEARDVSVAGALVKTQTPAGSSIEISNVALSFASDQLSGATFDIHNRGPKPLVAYVVTLHTFWDLAPDKPLDLGTSVDGFFLHSFIQPGQQETGQFDSGIKPSQPAKLLRVVADLTYAEFADGSTIGSGDLSRIMAGFNKKRLIRVAALNEYQPMLSQGVSSAIIHRKIGQDIEASKDPTKRDALKMIGEYVDQRGAAKLAALAQSHLPLPRISVNE